MKILCIIVTYNRLKLLQNCIQAVKSQTRVPDSILVVNNGSSDGTKEWLDLQSNLLVIHQENLGGAGGFYSGIEFGLQSEFDWFWCMDDDGLPDKTALEELLKHTHKNVSALNSVVLSNVNDKILSFGMPVLNSKGYPKLQKPIKTFSKMYELSTDKQTYPYGAFFNGSLLKKEAVELCGNVNKDLFIWGDEVEMVRRMWNIAPVLTILSSRHYHPEPNPNPPLWKLYYGLRNSIYINLKFFDYKFLRISKSIVFFFFQFLKHKRGLRTFFRAIKDGLTQNLQTRF